MESSTGHHPFAGFWSRAAARVIDLLIIIAAFNLIYLADRLGADAGLWTGMGLGEGSWTGAAPARGCGSAWDGARGAVPSWGSP